MKSFDPKDPAHNFWYKLSTSYMAHDSGHDKIVRFVQYSTRFLTPLVHRYGRFFDSKNPEKFAKSCEVIFNSLRRELSTARRTLRIFKQISVLWTVYRLVVNYPTNKSMPDSEFSKFASPTWLIFKCASNLLAGVFFSLDHVFWAYLIKLHSNRDLTNRVGKITDYIWITQSIFNVCFELTEMRLN